MSWKTAYLETRILSAGPVELVSILYEYAILRVQDARMALSTRDVAARAQAVTKVFAILGELEGSLNREAGGEIASNLALLYQYMRNRLSEANLSGSDDKMAEVEALLKTLGEAWYAIAESPAAANSETLDPAWAGLQAAEMSELKMQEWTF